MAIAADMKRLTEDMIAANDMRLRAVGTLTTETHETLKGFAAGRSKMATDQAKDLADFVEDLSKTVKGFLTGFRKNHEQMSKEQSRHLASFVQDLAQDVTSMLSRFEKEREHMSKELAERLAEEITDIKAAVEQILKDTGHFMDEQHSDMAKARQAWQNMSAAMSNARKAGFMAPVVEAGHKVCTAKQATRKTRGKKSTARKSSQ
ncbi:MAG: hypothetical protein NTZ17_09600 [Phycisphaerae bacterium]|nr:hypothetical protein [Phycisphaerae bacterium]